MLLGPYYGVPVTGALLGTEGDWRPTRRVACSAKTGRHFPTCWLQAVPRVAYRAMLAVAILKAMDS